MMNSWLQEPMEPIPEEGEEWPTPANRGKTTRKREIYTSEQVDTLVSTVPKESVPPEWIVENEIVEPEMAASYVTESLAGPHSARGTSYSYTYESHYDNPPEIEEETILDTGTQQTHKITRVTKVTTTRSVRQIPVCSPYGDLFFDSSGLPTPSPVVEIDSPVDALGIRLHEENFENRAAPPPAPSLPGRYGPNGDFDPSTKNKKNPDYAVPGPPGAIDILEVSPGEVTMSWSAPVPTADAPVIGYQIEVRDLPDGDWERAHDQLLRDTTCTITNLESPNELQFRVSAAGQNGFGPPSTASIPIRVHFGSEASSVNLPTAPGRPIVTAVDGHRATIEWEAPITDTRTSPVAGYLIEYRSFGTVDWMVATDTLITERRFTVDNLRPNGVYEFRVRAKNAEGLGVPSKSSGATHIKEEKNRATWSDSSLGMAKPEVPKRGAASRPVASEIPSPGQPQLVDADMDWVKLEWDISEEGAGYIVEFREVGDPHWYTANQHPIDMNCIHVEGLRPGSTYEFRVIGIFGNSASQPSEVSDVINLRPRWKPSGQKGVPQKLQTPEYLEIEGDRVSICWIPANSTLPVTGYDVEFRDFQQDAGWYKVNDAPVRACKMTVGDLIVGHEYQFRVLAHNTAGCSEPSDPSPPITIQPLNDVKYVEAERFGAVHLLQDEMVRESPPLPERDDSPPPLRRGPNNGNLQWRDPSLKEVIEYLDSPDKEKQRNASGYLQHLTFKDQLIKDETRDYGGIPKLVNLLRNEIPAIQKNAAACLKNLSFGRDNDKNKMAILHCDGVRVLGALLQTTHDPAIKEEVTAALWNLSSTDMLKPSVLTYCTDALAQQIVVPGLGFQQNGLSNGNVDPQRHYASTLFKNATGVIRNVSATNAAARKQLRECPNLIEGLVHFLTIAIQRNNVDSPAVENAVCILRNLSYRIQEVADPNYDPSAAHLAYLKASAKSTPNSPKPKKKEKENKKKELEVVKGAAVLWQPHVIRLYLKLLQEASNLDALEASAGAIQNLAACHFPPSVEVRAAVRQEKGLPVLVELMRQQEDFLACAIATALRNLSFDPNNRDLIGKYVLKDLLEKLPHPDRPRPNISDQTICAVLGILFEIVRSSAEFTKDVHEQKGWTVSGTDKLRGLARSFPTYSQRVCRYASHVLYTMWQHKELHDGFKRSGLKESDFYAGPSRKGDSTTLARPISSQGREKPTQSNPDDTMSSGYGAIGDNPHQLHPQHPSARNGATMQMMPPPKSSPEPLYASVRKGPRGIGDSWV